MSRPTLDLACCFEISGTRLSRPMAGFSKTILLSLSSLIAVRTPWCTHHGLGSSHFARRYFGNRCFFLFLRLLRCFSSPGSLPYVMDSRMDDRGFLCQVSPFRNLRIEGYLHLPAAYRSLLRLSSALSAKASTLRSCSLTILGLKLRRLNPGHVASCPMACLDLSQIWCLSTPAWKLPLKAPPMLSFVSILALPPAYPRMSFH